MSQILRSPCPESSAHIARPHAVIGYASTFLGLTGFYMSVAFYVLSIFINIICTGKSRPFLLPLNQFSVNSMAHAVPVGPFFHDPPTPHHLFPLCLELEPPRTSHALSHAVLIVWRVFYLSREFRVVTPRKNRKVWKVIEATVQSTAIYTAAGVSLVITFANSTAIGYPTCLNLFPSLIVRALLPSSSLLVCARRC